VSSALQVHEFIQEIAVSKTVPKNCQLTNLHTFFLCNDFKQLQRVYKSSHFHIWLILDKCKAAKISQ